MRTFRVVAAVICQEGKYLITQRRPKAVLPLLWEFPGGKVEPGEDDASALRREFKGRLGCDIRVGKEVRRVVHPYSDYTVELHVHECELVTQDLRPLAVNDFRWVRPEELDKYEFPGADQATVDKLISGE